MGVSRAFEKQSRHVVNIVGSRSKAGNIQESPWALQSLVHRQPCAVVPQHHTVPRGSLRREMKILRGGQTFPKVTALL